MAREKIDDDWKFHKRSWEQYGEERTSWNRYSKKRKKSKQNRDDIKHSYDKDLQKEDYQDDRL